MNSSLTYPSPALTLSPWSSRPDSPVSPKDQLFQELQPCKDPRMALLTLLNPLTSATRKPPTQYLLNHQSQQQQTADSKTEYYLCQFKAILTRAKSHIPIHAGQTAYTLYKECINGRYPVLYSDTQSTRVFMGACILVSMKRHGISAPFTDIACMVKVSTSFLMKAYYKLLKMLGEETSASETHDTIDSIINKIARNLLFPADAIEQCLKWAETNKNVLNSRSSRAVAGYACYVVGRKFEIANATRRNIAVLAEVSDVTLWTVSKIVNDVQ